MIALNKLKLTNEGYLTDWEKWDKDIACCIAEKESLTLLNDHWLIIHYLRTFYQEHDIVPQTRLMVKVLKESGTAEGEGSAYLKSLFPEGPLRQGCKIAGLPKPARCL